jgi:Bacterial Ig-like domain (group 2)
MRSAHDWGRAIARTRTHAAHRFTNVPLVFILAAGSVLGACSDTPTAPQADVARARESVREEVAGLAYPLVTIQPATTTMAVGAKVTLSAKLKAANAATWNGRFLDWKSSNTAVVSVSTSGGATGVAQVVATAHKAGTATITATTLSATTGTLTITVGTGGAKVPPPMAVTHEPAGMTVVANTGPITTVPPTATGVDWSTGGSVPMTWWKVTGKLIRASDDAVDRQPSGVRAYFPAGQVNDAAVYWGMRGTFATSGTGWVYARFKVRLEPGMTTEDLNAGAIKIFKLAGTGNAIMDLWSVGSSDWSVLWDLQGSGTTYNVGGSTPSNPITPGSWHIIEMTIQPNTSPGAGNGVQTIWIDDVMLASKVGMVFTSSPMRWTGMSVYTSRTIYTGVQKSTTYVDFDDYYISVK